MDFLSVISTVFALTGNLLVNYRKKFGFIIWSISNVTWILYNFVILPEPNWSMVVMYVIYLIFNIMGYIMWSKTDQWEKRNEY